MRKNNNNKDMKLQIFFKKLFPTAHALAIKENVGLQWMVWYPAL